MSVNTLALLLQQSQPGGIGSMIGPFVPMILIFAVFYFLLILPQRRRQRELQQVIANLKAGDRIVTTGGIVASVVSVRDTTLTIKTAEKTLLEISRAAVAGMQAEEEKK